MMALSVLFVFLVGLCIGSFLTLASYRVPLGDDIVLKPSRCPTCNTPLGVRDLFPLLSWLASHGTCRHCKTHIHWRYPLIELCTGLIFVCLFWVYGPTAETLIFMTLATVLLFGTIVDFEHYIIPDSVHVLLAILAVVYRTLIMPLPWTGLIVSIALSLSIGLALRYGYWLMKKRHGLGLGDVKFLGVTGVWLDVKGVVAFLFFSGVFGMLLGIYWRLSGRGYRFPFGPALAGALFMGVAFPGLTAYFWHIPEMLYR